MRKNIIGAMLLFTIAATPLFYSCQSAKNATTSKMLKFNFENGKGYDYEMNVSMDQEIMGQKMKMDMSSYYSMDVTGDDGSMKTVTTTFERIKMDMNVAGMDISVDSDKKGEPAGDKDPMGIMSKLFGAIGGRKFIMKINSEGKVEEVTGVKELATSIADSLGLEGSDREEIISKFNGQFNEQSMKDQFERVLYIFPNKEIKVGDSWEKNTSSGGQLGGKYTSTYTVKEIEGEMVTLEEKSKISSQEEGATMKGNVVGLTVVDSRNGLVVSCDQDMTISVTKDGTTVDLKAKNKIKGKAR
jgi:Family of unknown function (DUF6263)